MDLTGFLFGNINEDGDLAEEDNCFDGDCRLQVRNISQMCHPIVEEIVKDVIDPNQEEAVADHVETLIKLPSAVDYSEIEEMAVDADDMAAIHETLKTEQMEEFDDEFDDSDGERLNHIMQSDPSSEDDDDCEQPSGVLVSTLSPEAKAKFRGYKVTDLFPEFRKNKILRFNRLFNINKRYQIPNPYKHLQKVKRKLEDSVKEETQDAKKPRPAWYDISVPDESIENDEEEFLKPKAARRICLNDEKESTITEETTNQAEWRFGPAQYWYDMLGVDANCEKFDYGFKLKEETDVGKKDSSPLSYEDSLMLNQVHWEDDIIWNSNNVKNESVFSRMNPLSGWIPDQNTRTVATFFKNMNLTHRLSSDFFAEPEFMHSRMKRRPFYSIFPPENQELKNHDWESNIIWNAEKMDHIPEPLILRLDPTDENLVLEIPDDSKKIERKFESEIDSPQKDKKEPRRSKILLGKLDPVQQEPQEPVQDQSLSQPQPKHWLNLSNDEYYQPKLPIASLRGIGAIIQHSTPALQLMQPFFPTHISILKLRHFHRYPLKKFSHGQLSKPGFHCVKDLEQYIAQIAREREEERMQMGGGEMFFMRTPDDLSGRDGEVILAEYSEEHPPFLNHVGMATRFRRFYRKKAGNDQAPKDYPYGDVVYCTSSPFLGSLAPGEELLGFENNMYLSPIYTHKMRPTDFLFIRCREAYYIRCIDDIFTVGQESPLMEVPSPNSKRATNFQRDFLQVFIYRLFWQSRDKPRRIKMEDIRRAFPNLSESSVRKRLKLCADFKRTGTEQNWWVIKPDFRLPTEEEMRTLVTPEMCAAYFSMQAAEQRLKDAGYGDKAFTLDDNDDDDSLLKVEDEIKCAPWNTTRAFLSAIKGKCLLDVVGIADPTSCGEGFSYIKVPNKPIMDKDQEPEKKRIVTGTDADLRRLPLAKAKQILRDANIPEDEIKKLTRWEVIDVIRTLSTEKAKSGNDDSTMGKFARGTKFSTADHQEKYKDECQRIFEIQNKVLASDEVLSTDEDDSTDEDEEDVEELSNNIESMLANRKSSFQLAREREEKERKELHKAIMTGESIKEKKKDSRKEEADAPSDDDLSQYVGKVLKIHRSYKDDVRTYVRIETVRKPEVIDTYLRIRENKDIAWIRQFAAADQLEKEEQRKERRRLQDQLRRLKRNMEMGKYVHQPSPPKQEPAVKKEPKFKSSNKMKCGACGNVGHMKTNKDCPLFNKRTKEPVIVAMTQDEEEELAEDIEEDTNLIKVEDTKIILGKSLLDHAEGVRRKALTISIPKELFRKNTSKPPVKKPEVNAYIKKYKNAQRKRADPIVLLSSMFESLLNDMKMIPGSEPFHKPVNAKSVTDYYKYVKNPMDLQRMRDNVHKRKYRTRQDFLEHVNLMIYNSNVYNGLNDSITDTANKMGDFCKKRFKQLDAKFSKLEKKINPLLDDDDQVAFSFLLDQITNKLRKIPDSQPFHTPVSKKIAPSYHNVVKVPIDLSIISRNIQNHLYSTRDEYMAHIELLYENCKAFNGPTSKFTAKSQQLLDTARSELEDHEEYLERLEKNIQEAKAKAAESITSSSPTGYSEIGSLCDGSDADELAANAASAERSQAAEAEEEAAKLAAETKELQKDLEISDVDSGSEAATKISSEINSSFDYEFENKYYSHTDSYQSQSQSDESCYYSQFTQNGPNEYSSQSQELSSGFDYQSQQQQQEVTMSAAFFDDESNSIDQDLDVENVSKMLLGEISESDDEA